jgi:hypothetical protein
MNLVETGEPGNNRLLACLKIVIDGLGRRCPGKHYGGGHNNWHCSHGIEGVASRIEQKFSESS